MRYDGEGEKGLVKDVVEYGARYRAARKEDARDLEEALLQIIVENGLSETRFSELLELLREAGFDNVHWQTVRSDLKKLNIGFRTYKGLTQRSATVYIDLSLAKKRAIQRGLFKRMNEDVVEDAGGEERPDSVYDDGGDDGALEYGPDDGVGSDEEDLKDRVYRYVKSRSSDDLGVGVGTIVRFITGEYGVDVDEARKIIMELTREGKIYEHVIGYYKAR